MVSGVLAILDDVAMGAKKIAMMADDVASMAAMGTQKAAGVVIDDMAVTAGGMTGVHADRETNFVLKVARGSMKNKLLYLVPAALAINSLMPAIMPWLLMAGGAFLAFEGAEKIYHKFAHQPHHDPAHDTVVEKAHSPDEVIAYEEQLIDDAIKTDFVLSAEIIAISLAAMQSVAGFWMQAFALLITAVGMTFGVYGIVWLLVKVDDLGLFLQRKGYSLGRKIIAAAPTLFGIIGAIGTAAMLIVGGELILHGLHALPAIHHTEKWLAQLPYVGALAKMVFAALTALLTGVTVIFALKTGWPQKAFKVLTAVRGLAKR